MRPKHSLEGKLKRVATYRPYQGTSIFLPVQRYGMVETELLDLNTAIGDFLAYMTHRRGASPTTVKTYGWILADFYRVVGNMPVAQMNNQVIDRYARHLSSQGLKPKTFRNKLVGVKSFATYLYKYELSDFRPEMIELPKEQHQEANFLTPGEAKRLISVITDPRDKALILTLLTSGVRVSELTDIRMGDLYKRSIAVRHGKGNKPRITFITPETEEAIRAYLRLVKRTEGYLFANPFGNRLSRVVVARKVVYYAQKAGIKKHVTSHTLRHTMATTMLRNGARVEDVQQILGHSNIKTTLIYLHFTNYDLEKTYNRVMLKKPST